MPQNRKKIVVLYHNNCPDGFGAAWSAWKKFGNKATYIGVQHNEPPPAGLSGRQLYFLDFAYPLAMMKHIKKIAHSLVVIDHHKMMMSSAKIADEYVFNIHHSGSVLAWRYFHQNKKIPLRLLYIEDLDLWKRRLRYTDAARATLMALPYDFLVWDRAIANFENAKMRRSILEKGKAIVAFQERIIRHIVKNAELVRFCGLRTYAANTPDFADEVGDALHRRLPPIGIIWAHRAGKLVVSLRSSGKVNVARLAERFGGGGHRRSAAFVLRAYSSFPWKLIKK